jgi:sec-independent protein translocase protein TatC
MAAAAARAYQLPPEEPEHGTGKMSLLEHLQELRKRLIRCCIAVALGMAIAFVWIDQIVSFVLAPARAALPSGSTLIFTQPAEAFALYINVALIAGAVLASPVIMWQVWRFIAPGLYAGEKKLAVPFVLLTTGGAVGGAAFSHYIIFPYMLVFFGTFSSPDLRFLPRLEDAFDLYLKMLAGNIVVFQIPTVVFFLSRMRVVTARFLARNIKYAVLIIFIAAAVLTPSTDPWSQTIFAAPMLALYVLSIGIAWLAAPRRETNRDR